MPRISIQGACSSFHDIVARKKFPGDSEIIESDDTTGSVRMIKEEGRRDAAAIASGLAAEIYGMKILDRDVETEKKNYTRFLIIAREMMYPEKADKTSLVIRADNLPGSLYGRLKCFTDEGINLSKIDGP